MLQRVGVSFRSPLSPSDVRQEIIAPLRAAVESSSAGIYSNYMHQADASPEARDAEHLIVFEVQDFKEGLRVLRVAAQGLPLAVAWQFHNLNPSQPLY